ncbi:MAG: hypothetical protein AB8G15_05730 [Saprospiraceae bacterium]
MTKIFLVILLCLSGLIACQPVNKPTVSSEETPRSKVIIQTPKIVTLSDYFIKAYQGSIPTQGEVELLLYNDTEGNLLGHYKNLKNDVQVKLKGEIDLDESFVLQVENADGKEVGKFTGSISDPAHLTGIWKSPKGGKEYPFDFQEITTEDAQAWTGTWHYNNIWDDGMLVIGNVTKEGFDFFVNASRSGKKGELLARATLQGQEASFVVNGTGEEKLCEIIFKKHPNHLSLEQKKSTLTCGLDLSVNVSGKYEAQANKAKAVLSFGQKGAIFSTKEIHAAFKVLVGEKYYEQIAYDFQHWNTQALLAGDPVNAVVVKGNVVGRENLDASILLYTPAGKIWVASLADDGTKSTRLLRYFTTEAKQKNDVPPSIKQWAVRFGPHALIRE